MRLSPWFSLTLMDRLSPTHDLECSVFEDTNWTEIHAEFNRLLRPVHWVYRGPDMPGFSTTVQEAESRLR